MSVLDVAGRLSSMNRDNEVWVWYTRRELAVRWRVSDKTVSNWFWEARRQGLRPLPNQYLRRRQHPRGCLTLFRADYANAVWDRHMKIK